MTKVRIIFAPQFEPFQPYLSLPYLKELLRLYKIRSTCIDCNIDFYNWLFRIKHKLLSVDDKQEKYLLDNIEQAVLHIKNEITDLYTYRWAISVIEEYLQVISTERMQILLSNFEIENKYETDKIKDFVYSTGSLIHEYFDDHASMILDHDSDFYFFSLAILEQLPASLIFAKKIKLLCPKAKIAFGGAFVARFYKKFRDIKWIQEIVDFIEPDEGFVSIAKMFDLEQQYVEHISPDFSDFDQQQYLSPQTVFPYLIAHGCKWGKCVFCAHHLSYSKYHSSPMLEVIEDLKRIRKQYGVRYISFSDEYLTVEQLEILCYHINKEQLDISWSAFVRGEKAFTDDVFVGQLYSNGCRVLFFGFETFNQNVLNKMHKGTLANNYLPILDTCRRAGIAVRINLMFGFPSETGDDAKQTFDAVVNNIVLFDTPFSSVSTALFELRDNTPIFHDQINYNIQLGQPCRGDLDELYEFVPHMDDSARWREELMHFLKQEANSELVAPYNKTHQLILKSLYDEKKLELMYLLTKDNFYLLSFQVKCCVLFSVEQSQYTLFNLSNGCEICMSRSIWNLLKNVQGCVPCSVFLDIPEVAGVAYELLNFLYRNDFIVLQESDC